MKILNFTNLGTLADCLTAVYAAQNEDKIDNALDTQKRVDRVLGDKFSSLVNQRMETLNIDAQVAVWNLVAEKIDGHANLQLRNKMFDNFVVKALAESVYEVYVNELIDQNRRQNRKAN